MKWNKSTRLALYAAAEMAQAGEMLVTASGIAKKYRISPHHLAKVLQQLVKAGLARAAQGVQGGYRLAKSAKEITLLDVVEIFEGKVALDRCVLADLESSGNCSHAPGCTLKRVFDEIDQQAFFTLKSVRLSTLVGAPDRIPPSFAPATARSQTAKD